MNKPIELQNASQAVIDCNDKLDIAIEADNNVSIAALKDAAKILEYMRHTIYREWQILGGTSDIESIALAGMEVQPTPSRMESACSLLLAEIDDKRQFAVAALETLRNTPATNPTMAKTIHMTDDTRDIYDMTPIESDMPEIDLDGVEEIKF